MLQRYLRLKKQGVLSINRRNSDYLLSYNARARYPLVDDKLKTKQLALEANIAVPDLYAVIQEEHEIPALEERLRTYSDFVIKPAHGAGGDGILVITDRIMDRYRLMNGQLLTPPQLSYHLSCLLSGTYSLGGHPDHAIIERRVRVDSTFCEISYEGVPDIRIITLLGYPAMAMVRLPTRLSGGKANLHQGAIGVGIDLSTGLTYGGVFRNDTIDYHPDTLKPIAAIQVPYWDEILTIAARCYELTHLGYLGADIVLDKDAGPLLLELNARPGLNIQIANRAGLMHRYTSIEAQHQKHLNESPSERVTFSQQAFTTLP